jgi:hypothetical protein
MPISTRLEALLFFTASGFTAYCCCRRIPLPSNRGVRVLSGLVLWQLIQLLSVHLFAVAQMGGVIERVSVGELALLQAIVLAGTLIWSFKRPPELPTQGRLFPPVPLYLWISAVVLLASYFAFIADIFTSFPSGPDAIAYHLPLAVRWLQTGSLALPPSHAWRFSLPGNAEIGMMMWLATGHQSAIVLVNWVALSVLVVSIYLLAKRFSGGSQVIALTVAVIVLSIPMIEFQTFSGYVDLFGTAFFMGAITLFLHRKDDGESQARTGHGFHYSVILLSAAACGISLGTKPIYYLYGAGYGIWVGFCLWRELGVKKRGFIVAVLLVGAGMLLPSVFWFGRGLLSAGNPLFPMQIAVHGHVLLPGYPASAITDPHFDDNFVQFRSQWFIYPWTEWLRNPGYLLIPYSEGSGVGAVFASLAPLGILFLVAQTIRRTVVPGTRLLLFVLLVSVLAWWFLLNRLPRFGLPILVATCVLIAPLVTELLTYKRRAFEVVLILALTATCAISAFVPFHSLLGRVRTSRWSRADFYGYPPLLDRIPAGECVLNKTRVEEKNFSLTGKNLENCVVPAFETSTPLTADFLREHHVAIIAEIVPPEEEQEATPGGRVSLIEDDLVRVGEGKAHWRIWKVEP